ncbi:UDP-N-acetylglucosamine 3-dehydrogenase [Desulfosarcina ovata subsp. sediminis]|uniref:UDP-N-acetylglucosamine 3-dehydrogenase n=1 Tax=Desulfosarcina ovata subsp. sediminis TaxID=885957 RepID=A0A5K7ZNU8_9BACT|nr:Gfo/Idh/MocA family oxidoreductase [Desulfosarcina ovata]BBO81389.1 UDP-N-acetylglucosamine 3-dehydrogenase [Desulfosarcina ovata subsp. sediminis]
MEPVNTKLRIGVVGVGYLGKFHAQKYHHMPDVDLVGVADTDKIQGRKVADDNRTTFYPDHQSLFGKVDAVSIAAPTPAHFSIARDFLNQGVDVLIEKPITSLIEDADELIRMARDKNLIIQVGHLERFNPAVVALEGRIIQPRFIESHRLSIFQGRCTDVSVVLDLMIHDIDLILSLVKSEVKAVNAAGISVISGNIDIANARLEFVNGAVANVTASRISAKNERKFRLFQKEAYISIDFANHQITYVHPDPGQSNGIIPGMAIEAMNFDQGDALDDELKAFVQAVRSRHQPPVTGQMGRDALNIALSIMNQIQETSQHIAC